MPLHKIHGNLDSILNQIDGFDRRGNRFVTPANLSALSVMNVAQKEPVIRLVTDAMTSDARKPAFSEVYRLGHFKSGGTHYFLVLHDGEIRSYVLETVLAPIADRIFDGAFGDVIMTSLLEFATSAQQPRSLWRKVFQWLRSLARRKAAEIGLPIPSPFGLQVSLLEAQSNGTWKHWNASRMIHDFHVAPNGRTAVMADCLADYVDEELLVRSLVCASKPNSEFDNALARGIKVSEDAFFSRYTDSAVPETLCIKDGPVTRVYDGWFEHRLIAEIQTDGVPFTKAGTKDPALMLRTDDGRRKVKRTETIHDQDTVVPLQ